MMDGDGLPRFGARRDVLADGVLHRELAALLQEQDRGCRKLLGERAEAEPGLRRVRHVVLNVRHAIALAH
jgi:hypothetical protein